MHNQRVPPKDAEPGKQGWWYLGSQTRKLTGSPKQARILIVSVLGFPLLLALNTPVPGGSRNLSLEAGRRGPRARDTCSADDGMRTLGGHIPQGFQWTPEMGTLKRKSPKFLTLATN